MKPLHLIENVKKIKHLAPYAFVLGAIYQLVQLSTLGLVEIFSWTQVINDTFAMFPLLLIVIITYFSCINSIKQFQHGDVIESIEWLVFASLVVVYMIMTGYESLRLLILGFSSAVILKYISDTIFISEEDHIVGYTKFYDTAILLMPYVCSIILVIFGLSFHKQQFDGLQACIIENTTACSVHNVSYMNDRFIVTENKNIYPLQQVQKLIK